MLEVGARNSVDRIEEGRALLRQGQNQLAEWIPRILLEHNQMAENIAEVIQQTSARFSRRELTEGRNGRKVVRRAAGRGGRDEGTGGVGVGAAARQGRCRHEHVLRRRVKVVVVVVVLLVAVHLLGEHIQGLHVQRLLDVAHHLRRRPGVVLQVEWRQG